MHRLAPIAVMTLLVLAPATAHAQPAGSVADRITALEQKLQSLEEAAVQVPTISAAAQEAATELAALRQRLDTLERQQKSIPDAVAVLDRLEVEVGRLAGELSALRTEMAGIAQPSAGGGGSGGVSYDNKFGWVTEDGRFAISIDGYLHTRYQLLLNEDADDILESGLRLRRGRLGFEGVLGDPKVSFRVMAELTSSRPLLDYYVDYAIRGEELGVRVGQAKVQFTRNFITSSKRFLFPDRPQALERARYDRDIGVGLRGRLVDGKLSYYAGLGNGAGRNQVNDNIDLNQVVRVDFVALGDGPNRWDYGDLKPSDQPQLVIGGGAVHDLVAVPDSIAGVDLVTDVDVNGTTDNVRVVSASADARFRYRGAELVAEWLYRYEDWGSILEGQVDPTGDDLADLVGVDASRNYHAFFGMASYMVMPERLLVAARAGWSRAPFLGLTGRSSSLPRSAELVEVGAAVELYARGWRTLGLSYAFLNWNAEDGGSVPAADKEHQLIVEGQIAW